MSVNIILYEESSVERVRNRIYNYFQEVYIEDKKKNILYTNDIYIIFQKRIITINSMDNNRKVQECLDCILEDEQVTVNYGSRMEYSNAYKRNAPLIVNFS